MERSVSTPNLTEINGQRPLARRGSLLGQLSLGVNKLTPITSCLDLPIIRSSQLRLPYIEENIVDNDEVNISLKASNIESDQDQLNDIPLRTTHCENATEHSITEQEKNKSSLNVTYAEPTPLIRNQYISDPTNIISTEEIQKSSQKSSTVVERSQIRNYKTIEADLDTSEKVIKIEPNLQNSDKIFFAQPELGKSAHEQSLDQQLQTRNGEIFINYAPLNLDNLTNSEPELAYSAAVQIPPIDSADSVNKLATEPDQTYSKKESNNQPGICPTNETVPLTSTNIFPEFPKTQEPASIKSCLYTTFQFQLTDPRIITSDEFFINEIHSHPEVTIPAVEVDSLNLEQISITGGSESNSADEIKSIEPILLTSEELPTSKSKSTDTIELLTIKSEPQTAPELHISDLPSTHEEQPITVLEVQSDETPITTIDLEDGDQPFIVDQFSEEEQATKSDSVTTPQLIITEPVSSETPLKEPDSNISIRPPITESTNDYLSTNLEGPISITSEPDDSEKHLVDSELRDSAEPSVSTSTTLENEGITEIGLGILGKLIATVGPVSSDNAKSADGELDTTKDFQITEFESLAIDETPPIINSASELFERDSITDSQSEPSESDHELRISEITPIECSLTNTSNQSNTFSSKIDLNLPDNESSAQRQNLTAGEFKLDFGLPTSLAQTNSPLAISNPLTLFNPITNGIPIGYEFSSTTEKPFELANCRAPIERENIANRSAVSDKFQNITPTSQSSINKYSEKDHSSLTKKSSIQNPAKQIPPLKNTLTLGQTFELEQIHYPQAEPYRPPLKRKQSGKLNKFERYRRQEQQRTEMASSQPPTPVPRTTQNNNTGTYGPYSPSMGQRLPNQPMQGVSSNAPTNMQNHRNQHNVFQQNTPGNPLAQNRQPRPTQPSVQRSQPSNPSQLPFRPQTGGPIGQRPPNNQIASQFQQNQDGSFAPSGSPGFSNHPPGRGVQNRPPLNASQNRPNATFQPRPPQPSRTTMNRPQAPFNNPRPGGNIPNFPPSQQHQLRPPGPQVQSQQGRLPVTPHSSSSLGNINSNGSNGQVAPNRPKPPTDPKPSKWKEVMNIMTRLNGIFQPNKLEGYNDLKLPPIVVCGAQGSGKTSVLERILGLELQVKGSKSRTLCPIEIQLICTDRNEKWAAFSHLGYKPTKIENVRNVLDEISGNIMQSNEYVSENPIILKIYSPDIAPITLVDLPGLIEHGGQQYEGDEKERIYKLVQQYISNPQAIILFVASATSTNISGSKALRTALKFNPSGDRIVGVLTHVDAMDAQRESEAGEIISGNVDELKVDMIGLINSHITKGDPRNPNSNKYNLKFVEEVEMKFFTQKFPLFARKCGKNYFINSISNLLMKSILDMLQKQKQVVDRQIDQYSKTVVSLDQINFTDENRMEIMAQHLTKFVAAYQAQVDGKKRNLNLERKSASVSMKEIFDKMLAGELNNLVASETLSDEIIDIAISNALGMHTRVIISDDAFQELAKTELARLNPLVFQCVDMIRVEMEKAVKVACDKNMASVYPHLYNNIQLVAANLVSECYQNCMAYIKDYLCAEACIARRIKSKGFRNKLQKNASEEKYSSLNSSDEEEDDITFEPSRSGSFQDDSDEDEENAKELKTFQYEGRTRHRKKVREEVKEYFDVAKKDILEHVAKGITYKLIYGVSDKMGEYMVSRLHDRETAKNLMKPTDATIENRRHAQDLLAAYEEAKNVIKEVIENSTV